MCMQVCMQACVSVSACCVLALSWMWEPDCPFLLSLPSWASFLALLSVLAPGALQGEGGEKAGLLAFALLCLRNEKMTWMDKNRDKR